MNMEMPCESVIWHILPAIRKGLTKCMIEEYGLSQKEVAEKLGLTTAAISQYLSNKRGKDELNSQIQGQINQAAKRIIDGNEAGEEMCAMCLMIRKKDR